jgi:DNA-binding NtrC family response regulator
MGTMNQEWGMSDQERDSSSNGTAVADDPTVDLRSRVRAYERKLLLTALAAAGGNQRRAAASLGLLPTTFHEKLKRHGIRPKKTFEESE